MENIMENYGIVRRCFRRNRFLEDAEEKKAKKFRINDRNALDQFLKSV
jgi:hypothetical protein